MDFLTGNLTKYFKIINNFDLFFSFCTRKVLITLEFQQIKTFWYIFISIKRKTSSKYHRKSGWPCRGSQEGTKKKTPCVTVEHCNLTTSTLSTNASRNWITGNNKQCCDQPSKFINNEKRSFLSSISLSTDSSSFSKVSAKLKILFQILTS